MMLAFNSRLIHILLISLLTSCVSTPKPSPSSKSFLWSVEAEGRNDQCLIFGSFHLGVSSSFLSEAFWREFDKKKHIIFEVEIDRSSAAEVNQLIFNPPSQKLSDKISEKSFKKLQNKFSTLDESQLERLSLVGSFQLIMQSYVSSNGALDLELITKARQMSKKLHFLESFELQSDLLRGIIDQKSVESLLEDEKTSKKQFKKLKKVYLSGDEASLVRLLEDEKSQFALNREQSLLLLVQRNQAWSKKLKPILEKGNCLVVVGAAHLVGEHSLLKLLETQGFTVKRFEI